MDGSPAVWVGTPGSGGGWPLRSWAGDSYRVRDTGVSNSFNESCRGSGLLNAAAETPVCVFGYLGFHGSIAREYWDHDLEW